MASPLSPSRPAPISTLDSGSLRDGFGRTGAGSFPGSPTLSTTGSPIKLATSKSAASTLSTGAMLRKTFTGKLQPTMSRTESAIWKFAERPGPGAHHIPSTIGKSVDSRKASSRAHGIGTGSREKFSFWAPTCSQGPKYNALSSVGTQVTSKRANSPSFGFGTATRDASAKVYGRS